MSKRKNNGPAAELWPSKNAARRQARYLRGAVKHAAKIKARALARKTLTILALGCLSCAAVHADELRVHAGQIVTVYSGELTSINPLLASPDQVEFHADSLHTFAATPTTHSRLAQNSLAWTIYVAVPTGPYLTLHCTGNVPGFLGNTFAFDVECAP